MTGRGPGSVRAALAVYRLMTRLMPRRWRTAVGRDAIHHFEVLLNEAANRSRGSLARVALTGTWDLAKHLPAAHWRRLHGAGAARRQRGGTGEMMMNGIHALRIAARSLRRRPVFSSIVALTLALGIGATTAIFAVVDSILIRPLPYDDSGKIVVISHHAPGIGLPDLNLSTGLYAMYTETADFLTGIASYDRIRRNLTGGDRAAEIRVTRVTPEIFDVLRVAPALGRPFLSEDAVEGAPPVAILTDAGWRTRFGADPGILGRTVQLDGEATEVVGVMPPGFAFPDDGSTALTPMIGAAERSFGAFGQTGVARLPDGVTLEAAAVRLRDLQRRIPDYFPDITATFLEQAGWSVSVARMRDTLVEDIAATLWIVLGTVAFVLIIACANVANLFLVRAETGQRDVAIRAALGAGRRGAAAGFLAESLVLGLAGGAAGVALAWLGVEALVSIGPTALPRLHEVRMGGASVALAGTLAFVIAVVLGTVPVARYLRRPPAVLLREGAWTNTGGRERHRVRGLLVAAQLALALVLLVGSGLIVRSFAELTHIDLGFAPEGVMVMGLSVGENDDHDAAARFYLSVAERVAALPGANQVGLATRIPLMGTSSAGGTFTIEGRPESEDELPPVAMYRAMGPGYLESMGIPVLEGRSMVSADVTDRAAVAWINETMAREVFDGQALGERVRFDGDREFVEIVGVVGDTREFGLTDDVGNHVYIPLAVADWPYPNLETAFLTVSMADGSDLGALVPATRAIVEQINPNVPVTRTIAMEDVVAESMASTSFTMVLIGIATGVALFLGAMGLFGVISYLVGRRTREIGIRVALGARGGQVAGLILRQALGVTAIGATVGLAGAFGAARLLDAVLYEVPATDPVAFVAAPVVLVAVAFLATWLPARKASLIPPIEALRTE